MRQLRSKNILIYVQPTMHPYRVPVANGFADKFHFLCVATGCNLLPSNYSYIDPGSCFKNWISAYFQARSVVNANVPSQSHFFVFVPACTSDLRMVIIACLARLQRADLIIHGQGLFKKNKPSMTSKLASLFWISISTKYILYSDVGQRGVFLSPRFSKKICCVENRFESLKILHAPTSPPSRLADEQPFNLLFIGRDRPGTNLQLLLDAFKSLCSLHDNVNLHLIGPTTVYHSTRINCHGQITNPQQISSIASSCVLGVYPGDAGLSILHYMALGLCPIVHSELRSHSGPEPSHVKHLFNGFLFERDNCQDLLNSFLYLYQHRSLLHSLSVNAWHSAQQVHSINYSSSLTEEILS